MARIPINEHTAADAGVIAEPFGYQYARFIIQFLTALAGYEFHHPAPRRNVPPPTLPPAQALRWWSLDRPQRLKEELRLRDELVQSILMRGEGGYGRAYLGLR